MKAADRINKVEEYYFSTKLAEVKRLQEKDHSIINMAIGNPDLPSHPEVIKELAKAASEKGSNSYQSYKGLDELRTAFSNWYKRVYGVSLNPDKEILPLMGSKEAIMHIHMAFCNPGDSVLIPNPGYPAYAAAAKLLNLNIKYYDLKEENKYRVDIEELENTITKTTKLMWVNYPNMPTGAPGDSENFLKIIDFCKKNHILLVNDNPYSFILNDKPESILSHCNLSDDVMELNSLSKSHNMAGWRIGMLAGSESNIKNVLKVKSNFDSGMFKPIQLAAIKALSLHNDWHRDINKQYAERRKMIWELLDSFHCQYDRRTSGMFVWARIPENYRNGEDFSDYLLYEKGIFAAPGSVFGSNGDSYIRFSLCTPKEELKKVIHRIKNIESCELVS